ncbi:hypothetical protein PoB_006922900 [Plakobranchus ocellatus]|uniref:Uncharacterized protein n=1 Tax=Plakobranchus ocellatus TaxID=259542 RepID=A0AAV4DEU8_9GAST|nr:hypothetical protein PoB_006922900 [Plakobranchus ocellatus]
MIVDVFLYSVFFIIMGQDILWLPSSVKYEDFIWPQILKRSVHVAAAKKCPKGGQNCNRKVIESQWQHSVPRSLRMETNFQTNIKDLPFELDGGDLNVTFLKGMKICAPPPNVSRAEELARHFFQFV